MGLIDGTITPAMMEGNRFKDADVLALMAKCTIELPDEFADVAPETRCCRLTATLKNGKTVIAETRRSLDDDVADPGWEQAVDKFNVLTAPLLGAKVREILLQWVDTMETQATVAGLIDLTKLD
jgi:2-methylcitrate dehydratase PrpD